MDIKLEAKKSLNLEKKTWGGKSELNDRGKKL